MNRKGAEKAGEKTKKLTNETNDVNEFIQEIEKFFDGGEMYEQVVQMCDQGESKFPKQATTFWYYKAMCLDQLKKGDEAQALMNSILRKDPKHTGARSWFVIKDFEKKFDPKKTRLDCDLLNRLKAYANEIASNRGLVSLIKSLNESLEPFSSVTKSALDYQKKVKEGIQKGNNSEINYSSFKASLGDINENSIERFRELEKRVKEVRQDNLEDYTKFRSLFFFLSRLENVKKHANDLKEITSTIGVNYENLEYFYKIFDKTDDQHHDDDDEENEENEEDKKKHENVEMPTDFPVFKQPPFDKTSKPLGQIFDELCLDIRDENKKVTVTQEEIESYVNLEEKNIFDAISTYKQKFASNDKLINLLEAFEKVKGYSQEWKDKSAADIRNWADSCRGSLSNNFEAIAVMDRANSLLTGGHYLRHPQIISLLIFLETNDDEGKLLQISTGEGKTLIVSLFTAIRILKGETVDVITSNSVLAEEGVKERRKFFNLLNISVSCNNTDKRDEGFDKNPYIADVLYGCISNFQFDYLRDSFECKGNRAKRKFGTVMIDEVDSMLIDNGGHIAKLSGPLPGMDSLRYIYIKIWTEVIKLERKLQTELENSQSKLKDITDQIKSKVKGVIDLSEFKMIPSYLVEYAKSKLDVWVQNAIYARFYCHQDKQYVIKKVKDLKEDVVVPVDFENTGVTLKNTIWSNGLHQFVQLKHNLYLTSESLTSSFISNIGYIKKYPRIFGLSGTLGSLAEQDLLGSAYSIKFAKVPPYRAKKFHELPLLVAHDISSRVAIEASIMCEEGRAVLVICETIHSLKNIEQMIKTLNSVDSVKCNIKTFPDEDSSKVTEAKIQPGDVIISTNIAGRGTDFKTSEELEVNGGLHVIVAFLPCNKRVEDQAFGRTARQGKSGTAQIIIHEDEILNEFNPGIFFKQARDEQEKARINQIKTVQLAEINFNDKIFSLFSEVYVQLYKKHRKDPIYPFYLNDLKEFWAFWLDKNGAKGKKADQAEADFGRFKAEANEILNGKIKHNPYYCIKQANAFINNGKEKEAKEALENVISTATNSEILYSAHLKLFELAMEGGKQLTERFNKAMSSLIFLPYKMDEKYKDDAKTYLANAQKAIRIEADYLASLFEAEDFKTILWQPEENNFLLKHLNSRLACLFTYSENLKSLNEQLKSNQGLTIEKKIDDYLSECDDAEVKANIISSEINELDFTGLNEIYSLREVFDVAPNIIMGAQIQIGLGLAVLATGIAFPFALFICAPLAGTLISEGICDIIIELISKGETDYNWKEHVKSKCVSYGISIVTMGLSAVATSTKILNQAAKLCRGMSKVFAKSQFMRSQFEKMVARLEKCIQSLEKVKKGSKALVIYDKTVVVATSRLQTAKNMFKTVAIDTAKGVTSTLIDNKLITPALEEMFKSLKPHIKDKIKQRIESDTELKEKLEKNKREKIEKKTKEILEGDIGELVIETAKEISIGVIRASKNKWIKVAALSLDSLDFTAKILNYAKRFCKELKQQLPLPEKSESVNKESALEVIIASVADQLTEKLFGFIVGLSAKFTSTLITNPILDKVFEGNKSGKKENKDEGSNNQSKKPNHDENNQNQPKGHELVDQHLGALGIGADINDLSTTDIRRAFKKAVLNEHPDKTGLNDSRNINSLQAARDFLINHINGRGNSHAHHEPVSSPVNDNSNNNNTPQRGNGVVNNDELKLLIHGNSDKNQCGQMVFAELFQVNTHDLSRKTGVTNSHHGSHISDHEHQFSTLGLEPIKHDFRNSNKQDLVKFLDEAKTSAAMLFVNRSDMPDELGHVFLVRKQGNGDLVAYDRNKLIPLENLFEYKGTLLTGKNLDDHLARVQHEIATNPDAHPPVSGMRPTGQDEFDDLFGVRGKYMFGQISKDKMMTNDSLMISSVTRDFNPRDYGYIFNQAREDKMIRFDLQKHENIENCVTVRYSSKGPGKAHYCPFVENTHDWITLRQSEVTLSNKTPKYNCMLTGGTSHSLHSMCSFLVCIGEDNINVYCDSNPTSNANQKVQSILRDDARIIHRIDHAANGHIELPSHTRNFYGSNDSMKSGDIYLHHKNGQWNIVIQDKLFSMDGVELPVGNIRKINTGYYSDLLERIKSDENNLLPIVNPENKTRAFADDPRSFLNGHYLLQFSPMFPSTYMSEAIGPKSLRFNVFPGNQINQRQVFKIMPNEQGLHEAHYCPYLQNTHDWSSLHNSETIVRLTNPQHKYLLTGTFSGCAFIVAVGNSDMKVYHDSKPEFNVAEKNAGIRSDGENRRIIRVDHDDYTDYNKFSYISSEMPSQRLFYNILGGTNSTEVDSKNSKQARTGQIMLFYDESGWNIAISSYLAVNNSDYGHLPTDLSIFRLSNLV